jgi:hypothetical protein
LAQDFASVIEPSSINWLLDKDFPSPSTEETNYVRIKTIYPHERHRGNKNNNDFLKLTKVDERRVWILTSWNFQTENTFTNLKLAGFAVSP